MKNWQEEYQRKLITADDAAKIVKSGDLLVFTAGREAHAIGLAIAARKDELRNVDVFVPSPSYDFGWYDPGWEESFAITLTMPTDTCQQMVSERRGDLNFGTVIPFQGSLDRPIDVLLTEVSEPNKLGFCSFGASVWNKRRYVTESKLCIAEVNKNLIRTHGDNYVHVSEIDYFVEHTPSGSGIRTGTLAGRKPKEPEPYLKNIAENVSQIIKDRDTIQIGVGRTTEPLVQLGILDNKHDIGWYSEATPSGIISLVREGVINCKYQTIYPGKVVVTAIGGGTREEMEWVNDNPLFCLVDVTFLEDIRNIAANDNVVAINNALAIDITGQIAAETLGTDVLSVAGGQIPFVMGAWLSKGGRSITVLPATARNGQISRITPMLPQGTVVTIQRNCTDYVVTEYGTAHLKGKSIRQRVEELIAIAHPDHRAELRKEAHKLYWP